MKHVKRVGMGNQSLLGNNGRFEGDYSSLTNEELHSLLARRAPWMVGALVTDENRETVIAMLKITEKA
jgi:hypothetical protein